MVHPGDERHLAGVFQDNQVILGQRRAGRRPLRRGAGPVVDVVATFARLLPEGPRVARMREAEAHLDETWFKLDRRARAQRRLLLPGAVTGGDRRAGPPLRRL